FTTVFQYTLRLEWCQRESKMVCNLTSRHDAVVGDKSARRSLSKRTAIAEGDERMADLTNVTAGYATIGQGAGPMMVTWKAGLFKKNGLEVGRPLLMGGAKGVVRGLMPGEIQFGNTAASAPVRAILKGEADLVFLTGGINQQFIMGRPGIERREQLAGKKIGFVGDGGL